MPIKLSSSKKSIDYVKCLVYGDSGIGKTKLGSTAPRPIFIDAEDKLLSISDLDLPSIEVETFADVNEAIDFLKSKKAKKYETVIIDSLTEVAEIVLSNLREENKDGRQAYFKLAEEAMKTIRRFKKIKKNIVFICQLNEREDEGIYKYRPSMPGRALPVKIPFMVDEVFAMMTTEEDEENESYRYILTEESTRWVAKDSSGKLNKIEKPDLTHIFKKIKKKR